VSVGATEAVDAAEFYASNPWASWGNSWGNSWGVSWGPTAVQAILAATEATDTMSGFLDAYTTITLDATEATDTAEGSLEAWISAVLGATEAADTAAISITRNVGLDAESGMYTQTGYTSALMYGRGVAAEPYSYAINGNPAALVWDRVIITQPGNYTIDGFSARLYQSSFFYTDSEIIYVPEELHTLVLDCENRLIAVPAGAAVEELAEYRESAVEARMRSV
jgi:hypothetical protein